MLCVFFAARFTGDCPPFSKVLSFLGFCVGGFSATKLWIEHKGFVV